MTSCTTLQNVPLPSGETPPSLPAVKVGDYVVVTTKAMKKEKFAVTAIESDALVGDDVRIAYSDMSKLDIEHIHKGATTALVVAIAALVYIGYGVSHLFDPEE